MNWQKYIKGDKVIWMVVFLLSIISILVVYSSSNALAQKFKGGNTEFYLIKHAMIIFIGILIMYFVQKFDYKYYSRLSQIGLFLAVPLLIFTLFKGVSEGGASRWLEIPGTNLTFQTSDFAKLVLILYISRVLSQKQDELKDFKVILKSILLPIGIICLFIFPANFSTAALIFLTCLLIMFVGRVPVKFIMYIIGTGLVFLSLVVFLIYNFPEAIPRGQTWKARVENYIKDDSKSNYQSEQAKIAVARGSFLGVGPGNSTQRNFLPQAASDFIYAIIIEEYGSITGVIILFLYMILFFRGIRILRNTDKTFGGLVAVGLSFSLAFQSLINMAVAVNLFPVTGQPLPLISMGGTSLWFTAISLGIILSISKETEENEETSKKTELAGI